VSPVSMIRGIVEEIYTSVVVSRAPLARSVPLASVKRVVLVKVSIEIFKVSIDILSQRKTIFNNCIILRKRSFRLSRAPATTI
jgi:hypothetical protein